MRSVLIDKPVGRTPRRGAALIAALAMATAALGLPSPSRRAAATARPGGTTSDPADHDDGPDRGSQIFPVAGAHTFGGGFGAARSGHTHQGQDIMAACGTPLVAVSRAKVKWVSFQKARRQLRRDPQQEAPPGLHVRASGRAASVAKGQVVQPGQQLGIVGQTGNATACHLHFELWLGKWYRGGHPVNPLPYLQTYQGFVEPARSRRVLQPGA